MNFWRGREIQESRAVAGKPRDAAVNNTSSCNGPIATGALGYGGP